MLELLELEPVRRRFGIDAEDLPRIHGWILERGIRWGRDSDHRADTSQPRDGGNTWAFGLDRFALGVCMTSTEHRLVAGVAPMPDLEGSAWWAR